ncbi:GTP-binding protein, partial [Candidatus Bathyarchaeota archaeon]
STKNLKLLENYTKGELPIVMVSCKTRQGLETLGEVLFKTLGIIRVYTKEPEKREFSKKPFILKKGATVHDLARSIHSDFGEKFSYAKVWSKRLVFSPQKVGPTFTLEDGDVVEIHVR